MRVVGIDPSLSSTGFAVIEDDLPPITGTIHARPVPMSCKARAARKATAKRKAQKARDAVPLRLPLHLARLRAIRRDLRQVVAARPTDLVVIEWLFTSVDSQSTVERGGLWWMTVEAVDALGVPIAVVSPSTLKVYASADGGASKETVTEDARAIWPDVEIEDDNEADALWLAAIGRRHLGSPVDWMHDRTEEAMAGVQWPDLVSDDGEPGGEAVA